MPYSVRGKCIFKKDTGEKVGCTKGSVKKYLAALHMNAEANHPEIKELTEIYNKLFGNDNMKLKPIADKILKEESYKVAKGNKSLKNVFGENELKDKNSNPREAFKDYPLSLEDAKKKLEGIKDKEKLDRLYEDCFAQMTVPHERNMFRLFYTELRRGLSQKV